MEEGERKEGREGERKEGREGGREGGRGWVESATLQFSVGIV